MIPFIPPKANIKINPSLNNTYLITRSSLRCRSIYRLILVFIRYENEKYAKNILYLNQVVSWIITDHHTLAYNAGINARWTSDLFPRVGRGRGIGEDDED